jgi:hypothetical protein
MGLDMYLYKKSYVQNWDHHEPKNIHTVTVKLGENIREDIKPERITYIVEEVGYWRKFNALHYWFVEYCQDGVDDGREHYVSVNNLKELLETLNQVKNLLDKSKLVSKVGNNRSGDNVIIETYECEDEVRNILPPKDGFFFGGTEIDQYYKENIERSIDIIQELINESDKYSCEFHYHASW